MLARTKGFQLVFALLFVFGATPLNAQHLANTTTPRIQVANDLYLKFRCIIASGKGADDVEAILKNGDVLNSVPGYAAARALVSVWIKVVALRKGTPYCFASKWKTETGGKLGGARTLWSQKQYAKGQLVKSRLGKACATAWPVCLQIVKGTDAVDGMTTCVELPAGGGTPARSVVVGVGNFDKLVDADQKVMDATCAQRKF